MTSFDVVGVIIEESVDVCCLCQTSCNKKSVSERRHFTVISAVVKCIVRSDDPTRPHFAYKQPLSALVQAYIEQGALGALPVPLAIFPLLRLEHNE